LFDDYDSNLAKGLLTYGVGQFEFTFGQLVVEIEKTIAELDAKQTAVMKIFQADKGGNQLSY
jgi:hypothetical protein